MLLEPIDQFLSRIDIQQRFQRRFQRVEFLLIGWPVINNIFDVLNFDCGYHLSFGCLDDKVVKVVTVA